MPSLGAIIRINTSILHFEHPRFYVPLYRRMIIGVLDLSYVKISVILFGSVEELIGAYIEHIPDLFVSEASEVCLIFSFEQIVLLIISENGI